MEADLRARRVDAVRAWTSFVEHGDGAEQLVRPEIWSSWARSEQTISPEVAYAPLDDEQETAAYFRDSPLQTAVERVEEDLRRTAEDGDLVVAVASSSSAATTPTRTAPSWPSTSRPRAAARGWSAPRRPSTAT